MLFLLVSLFGIFVSNRFVYRLEMYHLIIPKIRTPVFTLLNTPSVFFLFFKEQAALFTSYIGVILLSLIFLNIYFEFFLKKVFFRVKIRILEAINLYIKGGNSPLKATKLVFESLSFIEKMAFEPLNYVDNVVDDKMPVPIYARKMYSKAFFDEIYFILRSTTRVSDQIDQFKRGLRIQNNLRHKSRLSALQVRAQAVVAAIIYIFLLVFAILELNLLKYPEVVGISFLMMFVGLVIILKKGSQIKWTI